MSKWDVARAIKASDLPSPARLIMWDLLDSADVDTAAIPEQFTPSLNDLVRTTGLGRSTVKRELNRLEQGGWVIRDRPDPVKARTEFARTGYRLAVPPRPTQDPGPEPRPTVDPGLGPGRAEARPTVGRIPIPDQSDPDPSSGDDRKKGDDEQLLGAIASWLHERTGRPLPPGQAPKAARCIFRTPDGTPRQGISDPFAYAKKAIFGEADPIGRFYPSPYATPTADAAPLPPHCGRCGDLQAPANPAATNPKFRKRADGTLCTCHPLHGQPLARTR